MFYYIKGELVMTDMQTAVVDCGGVGYKLTVSTNTLSHLTRIGEKVCLYTHFYIREDALDLLGFYSEAELSAFKLLRFGHRTESGNGNTLYYDSRKVRACRFLWRCEIDC